MQDNSWERIVDALDIKFGLDKHGRYDQPLEDKPELTQHIDFIEFTQNGQKFRLERRTGPAIVDRKTIHHKAAGSSVRFENIYDPEELTHKVHVLRVDASGDWEEADPNDLAI